MLARTLSLDLIRPCLEGVIPGVVATCDRDGVPNVAYLSQVEYVDAEHLALSFQFFNKTRRNVLDNTVVELVVVHPYIGASYRLQAHYLRTEEAGPLFERMRAKLAGIASHTGMGGVFQLRGADIYAVTGIEALSPEIAELPARLQNPIALLRRACERLAACVDLGALVEETLATLAADFAVTHAMFLMHDGSRSRLYTVGSLGYGESGAGSEVALGDGVIGVAARLQTPIRINHMTAEYAYSRVIREGLGDADAAPVHDEIPLPGLAEAHSQMALPMLCGGELIGVLFVESPNDLQFAWDDEDAMGVLAAQAATLARGLQLSAESMEEGDTAPAPLSAQEEDAVAPPMRVRYFCADGSVFFDDDYLIKGVAGAILWKLLSDHATAGRTEFSNRELRLAPELRLPDVTDNLEARLVLLSRRLVDRDAAVRLEKTGRGRFRLCVRRPLLLQGDAR